MIMGKLSVSAHRLRISIQQAINFFTVVRYRPQDYRFYRVMNFAALLGLGLHLGFIVFFHLIEVHPVARYNYLSSIFYVFLFFLNRQGKHELAALLGLAEVITHAALAVYAVGWQGGFQYYLFSILPFIYLNAYWQKRSRLLLVFVLYTTFIGLQFYARAVSPRYTADPFAMNLINNFNIGALFVIFSGLGYYYSSITFQVENNLQQANQKLETLAARDELTDLLNRREIRRFLDLEIARCQANDSHFVLVLGDIDNFKMINDRLGHQAGDYVLKQLARVMSRNLRREDLLARWGGEEFLILLPKTDLDSGVIVAEKLRERIAISSFTWEGKPVIVTMTFGVGCFQKSCDLENVLKQVDNALIRGKASGKNCVVEAPVSEEKSPLVV